MFYIIYDLHEVLTNLKTIVYFDKLKKTAIKPRRQVLSKSEQ